MTRTLLLLLAALSTAARAQSSPQPGHLIVGKAELLNTVRSQNLKPGDVLYLRTIGPWQQGDCTLSPHTTITAQVTTSHITPGPHRSVLALQFAVVPCGGPHPVLMRPGLVAVEAPTDAVLAELERYGSGAAQKNELAGLFPSGFGDVQIGRAHV